MKTAIIYYSLLGNTKLVVDSIAKQFDSVDKFKIIINTNKRIPLFLLHIWYSIKTLFALKFCVDTNNINWNEYDLIIIGGPVWFGHAAPPLREFVKEQSFNQNYIALFCSSGNGLPQKFYTDLKKDLKQQILDSKLVIKKDQISTSKIFSFTEKIKDSMTLWVY